MSEFYEASRALFAAITSAAPSFGMAPIDEAKIAALRALVAELGNKHRAIERAVTDLQNQGRTDDDLSRALLLAAFDYNGAQQLLLLAIDGREEILADAAALDDLTGKLKAIANATKARQDDVEMVTSVLDLVGKVTKLATG